MPHFRNITEQPATVYAPGHDPDQMSVAPGDVVDVLGCFNLTPTGCEVFDEPWTTRVLWPRSTWQLVGVSRPPVAPVPDVVWQPTEPAGTDTAQPTEGGA